MSQHISTALPEQYVNRFDKTLQISSTIFLFVWVSVIYNIAVKISRDVVGVDSNSILYGYWNIWKYKTSNRLKACQSLLENINSYWRKQTYNYYRLICIINFKFEVKSSLHIPADSACFIPVYECRSSCISFHSTFMIYRHFFIIMSDCSCYLYFRMIIFRPR